MMYQKIIVPIDHGNRNLKTEQHVFTSGILESDCKPVLGEFLQYNGRYYTPVSYTHLTLPTILLV